eukprot:6188293-Pleurochrysis_carterae.AAC.1
MSCAKEGSDSIGECRESTHSIDVLKVAEGREHLVHVRQLFGELVGVVSPPDEDVRGLRGGGAAAFGAFGKERVIRANAQALGFHGAFECRRAHWKVGYEDLPTDFAADGSGGTNEKLDRLMASTSWPVVEKLS